MLGPVSYWDEPFNDNITDYSVTINDEMFTVYLHRTTYFTSSIFNFLLTIHWISWFKLFALLFVIYMLNVIIYLALSENQLTLANIARLSYTSMMQYFGTGQSHYLLDYHDNFNH